MNDLIKRLRSGPGHPDVWNWMNEAADEIEQLCSDLELRNQTACDRLEMIKRLEPEVERLRAALKPLAEVSDIAQRLREGIDPADIPEAERAMDAGADEIERLMIEQNKQRHRAQDAEGALMVRDAEIERLRAAIRPLAEVPLWRDSYPDATTDHTWSVIHTVEEIRAARAALGQSDK